MARRKVTKRRTDLLLSLEWIVGNECYNANIQNWGPHGVFEGEGREFRYPITFLNTDGKKIKRRGNAEDLPKEVVLTGHYAFGANELHIMRALDRVLRYLEENQGLKL